MRIDVQNGDTVEANTEQIVDYLEQEADWEPPEDYIFDCGVVALPFKGYKRRVRELQKTTQRCRRMYVCLLEDQSVSRPPSILDMVACLKDLYAAIPLHQSPMATMEGAATEYNPPETEPSVQLGMVKTEMNASDAYPVDVIVGLPIRGLADPLNIALRKEIDVLVGVSGAGFEKWVNAIGALNLVRATSGSNKLHFIELGSASTETIVEAREPLSEQSPPAYACALAVIEKVSIEETKLATGTKILLTIASFVTLKGSTILIVVTEKDGSLVEAREAEYTIGLAADFLSIVSGIRQTEVLFSDKSFHDPRARCVLTCSGTAQNDLIDTENKRRIDSKEKELKHLVVKL